MGIMNNFINDIFKKLAQESSHLPHSSWPQSPSPSLIFFSVLLPTKVNRFELYCQISHHHEKVPDQVRCRRIWWDLAWFWPDLIGSTAAPPSSSPVLSNIGVFGGFLLLCFVDFLLWLLWWIFCCGDLLIFVVGVIFYLFVIVTAKTLIVAARQNRSTDPPDPTTLMDGQRVGALQTRLSWIR